MGKYFQPKIKSSHRKELFLRMQILKFFITKPYLVIADKRVLSDKSQITNSSNIHLFFFFVGTNKRMIRENTYLYWYYVYSL